MADTFRSKTPPLSLGAALLAGLTVSVISCSQNLADHQPVSRKTSIITTDNFVLEGDFFFPNMPNPPGLLLLHMLGSHRAAWATFSERAATEGYLVLAIDFRGHGASTIQKGRKISYRSFSEKDWAALTFDVLAGLDKLVEAGAEPDNLAIAGASLGANLALRTGAYDHRVQAIVMISPGLDYKGYAILPDMESLKTVPTLLLACEGDSYSAASANVLEEAAPGHCELRIYPGSAHGTDILASSPSSAEQIVQWLESTMKQPRTPR